MLAAMSLDPRVIGDIQPKKEGEPAPVHAVAVTSDGYALRFGLDGLVDASTRAGRRYARPAEGAEVVGVDRVTGKETMIAATADARGLLCPVEEINYLAGSGQGGHPHQARSDDDKVLGFIASTGDRDLLTVETTRGGEQTISTSQVRGDRTRRQGPRVAAARRVRACHVAAPAPQPLVSRASIWRAMSVSDTSAWSRCR